MMGNGQQVDFNSLSSNPNVQQMLSGMTAQQGGNPFATTAQQQPAPSYLSPPPYQPPVINPQQPAPISQQPAGMDNAASAPPGFSMEQMNALAGVPNTPIPVQGAAVAPPPVAVNATPTATTAPLNYQNWLTQNNIEGSNASRNNWNNYAGGFKGWENFKNTGIAGGAFASPSSEPKPQ